MPMIEVSYKDLCSLIGKRVDMNDLSNEYILYAKAEVNKINGDLLKIDVKDTNRPDLWSAEGIAREIKGRITHETGLPRYRLGKSNIIVNVDSKVKNVRPLTVCAVVKGLKINDDVLSQMIQLQEKVSVTFGRNRKEVAIGAYDLHKIKSPIRFTTVRPDEIKFIPLDFDKELTPRQILKEHPKGKEFGYLLKGCKEYPIFIDATNNILSLPPLINSEYTGKITNKTKDIFIECSGFSFKFLLPALNVVVAALADRGGKIQTVKVRYDNEKIKTITTPGLVPKRTFLNIDYANKLSGLNLGCKEMCRLLERARYKIVSIKKNTIELLYPAYRQDIMHQRDVVEDVIVSYGYNRIQPVVPKIATIGSADKLEEFSSIIAEIMVGLGLQEILSSTLTNKKNLFNKMNLKEIKENRVVEIDNIISSNWSVFRSWLLPSLLNFLSHNKHVDYPQKVFEIGDVVLMDKKGETKTRDIRKLAVTLTDNMINYENITSHLDALLRNLGSKYELKNTKHASFINGRVAEIVIDNKEIGIIGEIHPCVLKNWNLERPVAGFEIDISKLANILNQINSRTH